MPKELRAKTHMHRSGPLVLPSQSHQAASKSAASWTAEDDENLVNARAAGMNWQPIAAQHFPGRTANACRKRHERLMERRSAEEWDGPKLELLATEYFNSRREMWTPLATRLGEKWQTIEQKCLEKGFKNLQAAQRSAQRRERGMDGDDSGVAFSDAEHDILDDEPQMSLQQFHQMVQQQQQQQQQHHLHQQQQQPPPQPQQEGKQQGRPPPHHHRRHADARLSIHSMLSPSPDTAGYC